MITVAEGIMATLYCYEKWVPLSFGTPIWAIMSTATPEVCLLSVAAIEEIPKRERLDQVLPYQVGLNLFTAGLLQLYRGNPTIDQDAWKFRFSITLTAAHFYLADFCMREPGYVDVRLLRKQLN